MTIHQRLHCDNMYKQMRSFHDGQPTRNQEGQQESQDLGVCQPALRQGHHQYYNDVSLKYNGVSERDPTQCLAR